MELKPERTYTTRAGVTLKLRPISSMVIYQLQNDKWGMPQPPIVTVKLGPNAKPSKQTNPDDPEYKEALEAWQRERGNRFVKYVWDRGILDKCPKEDSERLREFLPGGTEADIHYTWICEQLADDDEIGELTDAIIGQTAPTEAGIAEAEATFPGNSEQS